MEWKTIDSAPKDGGKVILAKFDFVHKRVDDIFKEDAEMVYSSFWVSQGYWDEGRWTDGLERLVPPTHWYPLELPLPPLDIEE